MEIHLAQGGRVTGEERPGQLHQSHILESSQVGPVTRRSEVLLDHLGDDRRELVQDGLGDAGTTLDEVPHDALLPHLTRHVQKGILLVGLRSTQGTADVKAPLFDKVLDHVQVPRNAGREDQGRVVERVRVGPVIDEVPEDGEPAVGA